MLEEKLGVGEGAMDTIANDRLKDLFKAALIEVLEERSDLLRDIVEEAFEEIALARAIEVGENTDMTSRDEVFEVFEDEA
jgi:hypothetical protein